VNALRKIRSVGRSLCLSPSPAELEKKKARYSASLVIPQFLFLPLFLCPHGAQKHTTTSGSCATFSSSSNFSEGRVRVGEATPCSTSLPPSLYKVARRRHLCFPIDTVDADRIVRPHTQKAVSRLRPSPKEERYRRVYCVCFVRVIFSLAFS
jgi:hypothetical protein